MDEQTQAADTQAVTTAAPQAGVTPTPTAAQAAPAVDATKTDADKIASELAEARREAAKYRNERKALEAKLAEFEAAQRAADDAKLSEQEKLQKRLDDLTTQLGTIAAEKQVAEERSRALALKAAVLTSAANAGIAGNATEAAYKLLDLTKIELDDDGTPKNVDKALKALVEQYPFLRGAPATSPANPQKQDGTPQADAARTQALRARIYGTPGSMFDPAAARARGGGVVNTPE